MTPAFHHLFMVVSDLERTRRFYVETLGFEVLVDEPGYIRVGGRDGFHIGMEEPAEGQPLGGSAIEIDIEVADVDAEYERLLGLGVTFDRPPDDMPWGARHVWLSDPDGYRLSLFTAR